jgi:hypothetical protein
MRSANYSQQSQAGQLVQGGEQCGNSLCPKAVTLQVPGHKEQGEQRACESPENSRLRQQTYSRFRPVSCCRAGARAAAPSAPKLLNPKSLRTPCKTSTEHLRQHESSRQFMLTHSCCRPVSCCRAGARAATPSVPRSCRCKSLQTQYTGKPHSMCTVHRKTTQHVHSIRAAS